MTAPISTEFLALQEVLAGRYSIERELGRGGMGIVLLARDVALDRPVAIKLLPPALAANPEARDRFLQEARTAAGLSHPNIVPIHLVEARGTLVYFVMGYVDGETLRERVERSGPLSPRLALKLLQEVSWALGYAHQRGVIHRDVKPDNIMIERATDRALVTDFGIALGTGDTNSVGGQVIGTARYMSPEQACGEPVDARSDLYSLGATFFFALTGRAPFEGSTLPAILAKQVAQPAPTGAVGAAELPAKIGAVIDRCLQKAPGRSVPDRGRPRAGGGRSAGSRVPRAAAGPRLRAQRASLDHGAARPRPGESDGHGEPHRSERLVRRPRHNRDHPAVPAGRGGPASAAGRLRLRGHSRRATGRSPGAGRGSRRHQATPLAPAARHVVVQAVGRARRALRSSGWRGSASRLRLGPRWRASSTRSCCWAVRR